jgi:acetate kinase
MQQVIAALTDKEHGVIRSMDEIGAVGHRVVHGGEKFADSVLIDEAVLQAVEEKRAACALTQPRKFAGDRRRADPSMPNYAHGGGV